MNKLAACIEQFSPPRGRPLFVLLAVIFLLLLIDRGEGYLLTVQMIFSVTQLFATLGLIALALSITMIMGEFDLSVAGSFAFAGAIAVLTGTEHPILGILCGAGAGLLAGIVQGALIATLQVPAVALSLGGLLVLLGLTYVVAGGGNVQLGNTDASHWMQDYAVGHGISNRGLIVVAIYVLAGLIFAYTRPGRDMVACGSNRAGALLAGINLKKFLVAAFAASGALAGLGGAMLAYSLGSASAIGLSDVLVPGAAAAILGGVSLTGGKGRPIGVAFGVLTWCVLRSGLTALGITPFMLDTIAGSILLLVAVIDSPGLSNALSVLRDRLR
jgi:ribose/xylose/arabinose/galactoside ABC-type transport system permease subunit